MQQIGSAAHFPFLVSLHSSTIPSNTQGLPKSPPWLGEALHKKKPEPECWGMPKMVLIKRSFGFGAGFWSPSWESCRAGQAGDNNRIWFQGMEVSQVEDLYKQEGFFHEYGGVERSNIWIRNILWRSTRLIGSSSSVTIARIVLDAWASPKIKIPPASATAVSTRNSAGSRGKLSYSLISTFISCQCSSVHLSNCSTIGKWTQLFWISHFLSLFFFLNDLLLVNETSCCLGKGRIGHDFQPNVPVSTITCSNLGARGWLQEQDMKFH